ncbi:IS5 family transposase [Streptomyces katrae]|uniref:IS5 family transposase n=1 Tax=Streptomyces katrae TaxID=68223 RepID=UPI003B58C319
MLFRAGVGHRASPELTSAQWERIAVLLPETGTPGGRWAGHRTVVTGVLYRTRTGIPWPDLPERYGCWQTVYERHRRWSADGTWSKILRAWQAGADSTAPDADVRGRATPTPPPAGPTSRQPGPGTLPRRATPKRGGTRVDAEGREALGRSRGGLTSKVHLLADDRCRPLVWLTSLARRGDSPMFLPLMQALNVARTGAGRPRTRPDRARGDKAYASRVYLRKRGIEATNAQLDDECAKPPSARPGRRPPARLRPRAVPPAQHHRTLHRKAETTPGRRDSIRQTRLHLQRPPGHSSHRDLAPRPHQRAIRHCTAWTLARSSAGRYVPHVAVLTHLERLRVTR